MVVDVVDGGEAGADGAGATVVAVEGVAPVVVGAMANPVWASES